MKKDKKRIYLFLYSYSFFGFCYLDMYFYRMNASSLISEITLKVTKLKLRSERLEKENEELRNTVFTYLKELETQKIAISTYKEADKNRPTTSLLSQKELDKYILLIDKCIASIDINLDK